MRVLIENDVELYPEIVLHFGDEIAFPAVPSGCDSSNCGIDVPDDVAARWKAARDAWFAVQREADAYDRPDL